MHAVSSPNFLPCVSNLDYTAVVEISVITMCPIAVSSISIDPFHAVAPFVLL